MRGTFRRYTVGTVLCSTTGAVAVNANTVVLSARMSGLGATFIKGLHVRDRVRVGWNTGTPDAMDVVSGNAQILTNGAIQFGPSCTRNICLKNPRTSLGVTATGRIILLVVDGRSSGSIGFTLNQLAHEMIRLGAVDAVNLDGGGSATLVHRGHLLNRPYSDHDQPAPASRPIVTALLFEPA